MKKFLSMLVAVVLAFGFGLTALADSYEIGMITDIGTIDDKSFNQGSWEGIVAYADANGKTYNYYQPSGQSNDLYLEKIEQAVQDGAVIIVTPGYLFEEPIFYAQDMYPDVKFVLIDGTPHDPDYTTFHTADNTVGIVYAEEQSGYLAGYACVVEGYTKLGFMGGMAVPAVVRFGYGFVQGANAAALELGVGEISVNYHYTGGFIATPEVQAMAASWYQDGVEVIFACGGAVGNSVMAAAEDKGGKVVGVDVDQSRESETTVITSAVKGLSESVEMMLAAYYEGTFPGGQNLNLGAADHGVGLPMETSKFNVFTQEAYDALYAKLAAGEIAIQKDDVPSAADLQVDVVSVTIYE